MKIHHKQFSISFYRGKRQVFLNGGAPEAPLQAEQNESPKKPIENNKTLEETVKNAQETLERVEKKIAAIQTKSGSGENEKKLVAEYSSRMEGFRKNIDDVTKSVGESLKGDEPLSVMQQMQVVGELSKAMSLSTKAEKIMDLHTAYIQALQDMKNGDRTDASRMAEELLALGMDGKIIKDAQKTAAHEAGEKFVQSLDPSMSREDISTKIAEMARQFQVGENEFDFIKAKLSEAKAVAESRQDLDKNPAKECATEAKTLTRATFLDNFLQDSNLEEMPVDGETMEQIITKLTDKYQISAEDVQGMIRAELAKMGKMPVEERKTEVIKRAKTEDFNQQMWINTAISEYKVPISQLAKAGSKSQDMTI